MVKLNVFTKMILVILLLLIPTLIFYSISNSTSIKVVEKLIQNSTSKQLSFFSKQLDNSVNQLSDFAVNMTQDPNVREFMGYSFKRTDYEEMRLYSSILEKLELYSISTTWPSKTTVFSMQEKRALSGSTAESFDPEQLRQYVTDNTWQLRDQPAQGQETFYYYSVVPAVYKRFEDIHAVIEVNFPRSNIENMLDQYESVSNGQAFLFSADQGNIITAKSGIHNHMNELQKLLQNEKLSESGNFRVNVEGVFYELYYERVSSLGWYIVDYVPKETILHPIRLSQINFYITISLLLAVGVVFALTLYRNVQFPIMQLIRNIERVKQGDYVTPLRTNRNKEFQYLFDRFNEMTLQIRLLIEKVYEEKLQSRNATLKQLQSQINPHFLYNCLSFIMNMTKLKKHDDVVMMTYHLSQYYRYVTRIETETVPLSIEMEFTLHYLKIIQMRFVQIDMEYDIPDSIKSIMIPKLLIQPIVENAVKHGVEKTGEHGRLWIRADKENGEIRVVVEDNGVGMTDEEIEVLMSQLQQPIGGDIGTGLRNVHKRLLMHFGDDAGIKVSSSESGGLKVILYWKDVESVVSTHDGIDDRR
ncbi:cache domain-containing sensor histidine kinase [Cohnella luojiensis]|uniref:HAMP domain-containing protein n=1 Tax=Cohnella luojiensis TaxID=652876 RepID=A0A4Y8M5C0_9BACL|nr:sensor histidine kinase [Cohnella luojiensis]TFE30866.1 HAMP domain-containing protein [Cohnella luojiensis]